MSARRPAAAEQQPPSFVFAPDTLAKAQWWLGKYPENRKASGVIPILWLIQKQEGWVSIAAMEAVAAMLGMAPIRVLEVATFYTMFNLEPVGRYLVQLCGTTPCMLRGAEDLKTICKARIGAKGHMSADGMFTWVEVECLGACVNAPMVQINDYFYEDLTPETLDYVLTRLAAGEAVAPGNFVTRDHSAPEGPARTLIDESLYDGSRAQPLALPNAPAKVAG